MKKKLKYIYNIIPLKRELFSFLKKWIKPSQSVYQHLHFKGNFEVSINPNESFHIFHHGGIEENEIFWNGLEGGWEKKSTALWIELARNSNSIFDIGANTGLYALIARTVNPKADIHTFEPIPGVFSLLKKNTLINNYTISNHELALSNFNGTASIFLPIDSDFAYSVTVNKNRLHENNKAKELTVKTQTLKSFIEEKNIQSIDLMKIDVETHEPEVLEGMGEYLTKYKPNIIIEVLENEIAEQLKPLLNNLGYFIFNIDDKNNTIRRIYTIEKSDYWNLLLCDENTAKKLNLI
jgi:FkbM family methyltransferase